MQIGPVRTHIGVCDASAAVFMEHGSSRFLVADDEDQQQTFLRLYDADADGPPVREFHLSNAALEPDHTHPEIDLEGAAWLGGRIFWTGSHSASRKGKHRQSRHRIFATVVADGIPQISGKPYRNLVKDLAKHLDLDLAADEGPKDGGLSIEGLSRSPVSGELLIAFRSPLVKQHALIVPWNNPDEVVDHEAPARFGDPILLDLGGLGIRSLEYWPERTSYLLLAGPSGDGNGSFHLMRWSGPVSSRPEILDALRFDELGMKGGAAEGLLISSKTNTVYILFDEGNRRRRCRNGDQPSFHTVSVTDLLPRCPACA